MPMNRNVQMGVSLIEVLVTMVILAIGLLGVAGMQVMSVKNTQVAAQRSIATQQAYDIVERMRANLAGVVAGDYDNLGMVTPADPACGGACSPALQAVADHRAWNLENARVLTAGSGSVVRNPTGGFDVTLSWTEQVDAGPPVNRVFVTENVTP